MQRQRLPYALLAAGCAGLLAFGYYLQYVRGLEPCPLCLIQRGAFHGLIVLGTLAALAGPGPRGVRVWSALVALCALAGAAVAGRQVWLQHLPPDLVPACGPGLEFMWKSFPMEQFIRELVQGSGECAEAGWTFLSLSIAEWSLAAFVVIVLLALAHVARPALGLALTGRASA